VKIVLRFIALAALAFSVSLWFLYAFPFWKLVPNKLLLPVSAHGCGSAYGYRMLYESDPELRARILPVVMISRGYRGDETEISQWSCDRIADVMRAQHPALGMVPKRFLCQSVRRHVRELYTKEHYNLGSALWIIDDQAVGPAKLYEALTAQGIAYTPKGLEVREPPSL
jgi:hypothetical protein